MALNTLNVPVRNREDVSFHINQNDFTWLIIQIYFTFTTILIKLSFKVLIIGLHYYESCLSQTGINHFFG
jgi:hypothetical protein